MCPYYRYSLIYCLYGTGVMPGAGKIRAVKRSKLLQFNMDKHLELKKQWILMTSGYSIKLALAMLIKASQEYTWIAFQVLFQS